MANTIYNGPSWTQAVAAHGSRHMLVVLTAPEAPAIQGNVVHVTGFTRGYFQVSIRLANGTTVDLSGDATTGATEATYKEYRRW